jgi:uncharacterized protein (TIGR03382 family)
MLPALDFVLLLAVLPEQSVSDPQAVTGGADVMECAWIDTVAVTGGGGLCTGALVHPRVVTFAAHCGEGEKMIRFGEADSGDGLAYTRSTSFCRVNPEYVGTTSQGQDWAFCVLEEPIVEIPYTPPLYGCELDVLDAGLEVYIAGFGDEVGTGGAGTKRWAQTTVISTFGNTINIGGGGVSTCMGDSGGSAFVVAADGSMRAISMVSTGTDCGNAGVHALMHPAVPWIESEAQIDITPCHDVDGTWNPTAMCTGFYAGNEVGYGSWEDWCPGTPTIGASDTCGATFDSEEDGDAPTVAITSPADGEEIESGTAVTVAIDATDPGWGVRHVWISIEGMEQAARDEYPPYEFANVQFPDDIYRIQAYAEDWAGNVGMSAEITIGVGMPVPSDDDTGDPDGSTSAADDDTTSATDPSDDDDDDESDDDDGDSTGPDQTDDGGGGGGCSCTSGAGGTAPWLLVPVILYRRIRRRS